MAHVEAQHSFAVLRDIGRGALSSNQLGLNETRYVVCVLAAKVHVVRTQCKGRSLAVTHFCMWFSAIVPPCISYGLVQATVGLGTIIIWDLI